MLDDERLRQAAPLVVCVVLFLAWVASEHGKGRAAAAGPPDISQAEYRVGPDANPRGRTLTQDRQAAGFTFQAGTDPRNIALFQSVIASAHPDARRLIELIDGLTTIRFVPLLPRIAGRTRTDWSGIYEVQIDLYGVTSRAGTRALRIVVLHELGHVIDSALVSEELRARMDAGQPPCPTADCRDAAEKFAEHFARWATGDLGIDVPVGYQITAPVPLYGWGETLRALTPDR